jgi:FKBP-type peptidyl-prolyl cis-trans isomerase 2
MRVELREMISPNARCQRRIHETQFGVQWCSADRGNARPEQVRKLARSLHDVDVKSDPKALRQSKEKLMTSAQHGDTVKIHYVGKLEDGTVFAASAEQEPLEFKIGQQVVLPALELAVVGMEPGEKKRTEVPPEEGYGPHRDELVVVVAQEKLPDEVPVEVGQSLRVTQPNGESLSARITGVADRAVTLDANHPLAGQKVNFDLQLIEVL